MGAKLIIAADFFSDMFGAGPIEVFRMLDDWRQDELEGLEHFVKQRLDSYAVRRFRVPVGIYPETHLPRLLKHQRSIHRI